jgi:hypothetical protein
MALVQIARFEDPNEGEIAANALRAEGIETVFNNQGLATTDFLLRTRADTPCGFCPKTKSTHANCCETW